MKKYSVIFILVLTFGLNIKEISANGSDAIKVSISSSVQFPEYSPWKILKTEPLNMRVSIPNYGDASYGPTGPMVTIGTATYKTRGYELVAEYEILGSGVLVREHVVKKSDGGFFSKVQILKNKKWINAGSMLLDRRATRLYLTDEERFKKDGFIKEILLSFRPINLTNPPVEIRIKNKQ